MSVQANLLRVRSSSTNRGSFRICLTSWSSMAISPRRGGTCSWRRGSDVSDRFRTDLVYCSKKGNRAFLAPPGRALPKAWRMGILEVPREGGSNELNAKRVRARLRSMAPRSARVVARSRARDRLGPAARARLRRRDRAIRVGSPMLGSIPASTAWIAMSPMGGAVSRR